MAVLTPQFKIKQGEFVSDICKYFKVYIPAKHKTIMCERNRKRFHIVGDCTQQRYFSLVEISSLSTMSKGKSL